MNYLAHAYLSFRQPGVLLGNMISDHVKGKKQYDYPGPVQRGIRLHRAIDAFTDSHPATQELKSFFKQQYRLYSGPFSDIIYDHFLANDINEFESETALKQFAKNTYEQLNSMSDLFPVSFQKIFPFMKGHDWLSNYRHSWAIEKSFDGLVRRSTYLTESKFAFELFQRHYHSMGDCFSRFFPDVKKFAEHHLPEISKG